MINSHQTKEYTGLMLQIVFLQICLDSHDGPSAVNVINHENMSHASQINRNIYSEYQI